MQFKDNTKQRNKTIQGLRSFKDTLPKNVKKIINKKGHIYSETLNNWKYIVGEELFKICYPKSFKNSNRFGVSTLMIMVKRGCEVEVEYSTLVLGGKVTVTLPSGIKGKITIPPLSQVGDRQRVKDLDIEFILMEIENLDDSQKDALEALKDVGL